MKKTVLILVGVAVGGWAVAALVVGSPGLGLFGAGASVAMSPACLPATVAHSARLEGTGVDVSPAPGTGTAGPRTQISFLGTIAANIREPSAVGSKSGGHRGRLLPYSQGDGASFVPDRPFDPGERVTVRAVIGADRSGSVAGSPAPGGPKTGGPAGVGRRPIAFSFRVDTPYPTAHVPEFPAPPAAPADAQSFYTLPGIQAPILTVTTADRDPAAGYVFTTNGPGPGQYGPLIYTPTGRLVWFDRPQGGATAEDLNVQSYEGKRVLTWWRGKVLSLGFGQGEDVVMNGEYRTVATVRGGNGLKADLHDFQIAPGGVAYITAYNPIRCDLAPAKGSAGGAIVDTAIQEIDMRTGLVRWEWHSLDHVRIAESETETPKGTAPWDWFHLNSIDREPGGNILISARSTWAEYQLEGGSGKILWRLGGNNSSFKMGKGTGTAWQHDGRMLSNGEITLFDDGANPPIHSRSRAVVIALDFKRREARLVRSYVHPDPPLLAASQGNMQTTAAGNAVVGYGGVPEISEYAPDGSLLLDAHLSYDLTFYRAFRYPWTGRPQSPPEILASMNNTGEETIVHASWNGATDVAAWRVLAGDRPGSLTPKATIPASGFESSTTLPKKYAWVAVKALDSSGRVLGTSPTVAPIGFYASLTGGGGSK